MFGFIFLIFWSCTGQTEAPPSETVRVPAVYVLDDRGAIVTAFGYPGSKGKLCMASLPEIPDSIICQEEYENPLQTALFFAKSNQFRDVRLDAATYTFPEPQNGFLGKFGFRVPSNIHLKGVMGEEAPQTVLAPAQHLVDEAANSPSGSSFDVLLLPFDNREGDVDVLLNDVTIESLFLDNKNAGNVCMWANGGKNFQLLGVHSRASRISSLILGFYYREENKQKPYTSKIHYARNFEIAGCHVHSANGDGICVIGKNGVVRNNICENGGKGSHEIWQDNGLTCFVGSDSISFTDNQVFNFHCGIGLDGTYLYPHLPGMSAEASRSLCLEKEKELYRHWTGYNRNIIVSGNEIRDCNRGIVVWRGTNTQIFNNTLEACKHEGISLEEAMKNMVWGNAVHHCAIACRLTSYTESALDENGHPIGTSYNKIGFSVSGGTPGNNFSDNKTGIQFDKPDPEKGRVADNQFINNDVRNCDYSMSTESGGLD